jgi:hypothetical protein
MANENWGAAQRAEAAANSRDDSAAAIERREFGRR